MATPFYRFVKSYGPPDSKAACDSISPASPVQQQQQRTTRGDSDLLRPLLSTSKETFKATASVTYLAKSSNKARLDSMAKDKCLQGKTAACRRH